MKTVHEVSEIAGVSVRTLRYYDEVGLLKPAAVSEAGYRLYDDAALERLQHILMYRELQFPIKDVKSILNSPDFDRNRALEQQIELLTLKKEHLETLILFARGIQGIGVRNLDFTAFDARKLDEYVRQAKEAMGPYQRLAGIRAKDKETEQCAKGCAGRGNDEHLQSLWRAQRQGSRLRGGTGPG